jgi:osmotically inducible protein OsmC
MPVRTSSAVWKGTLKEGSGTLKTGSGAYEGPYNFVSRFESGPQTNPEELVAAAHAGCYSMALSAGLERAGFKASRIATKASLHLDKVDSGFAITRIELDVEADVPGVDEKKFAEVAEATKSGCPISKLVTGAKITLKARLLAGATARA